MSDENIPVVRTEAPEVAFVESTADIVYPPFVVRVWRKDVNLESAANADHTDVYEALHAIVSAIGPDELRDRKSLARIVAELVKLPWITAVQVKRERGQHAGVVAYTEWP